MKENKKFGWLVCLVCLMLCLSVCLVACGGDKEPTEPSETAGTTLPETEATQEPTQAPTEATTVPVEETTAPTEETQPSGSSTPGGSGGYNPGTTQPTVPDATTPEETQPAIEVGQPGTETNAYLEAVNQLPGTFTTVKIPANSSVYYRVQTEGQFLTVADSDASVVVGETTYAPENGVVTVPLTEETPALQICNNGAEEKTFTVNVLGAIGSASNPEVLTSVEQIVADLEQGSEGRFYSWTADRTGLLLFGFDSVLPENAVGQLYVTVDGMTSVLTSADAEVLWAYITEGQELLIQLAAAAEESGNVPAAQVAVSTVFVPHEAVEITQIPTTLETEVLPIGGIAYYTLSGVADTNITIWSTDVFVICNDITYGPDDFGAINIPVGGNDSVELLIGNIGEVESAFAIEIAYGESGPQELMIGEKNVASLGENDDNAVFTWTAYLDGQLKLTMDWENYSGWYMQVVDAATGAVRGEINSDGFENAISLEVKAEDQLQILVNTHEYDSTTTPAGTVTFHASFVSGSGTQEDPYSVLGTDFNVFVPAGQTVYCTGRFSGMNAEVYGENITVENDGKAVVSDWGCASLIITGGDFFNPPVFSLTNTGEDTTVNVMMTYPMGSAENPQDMYVGEKNTATLEANDDGYYFRYVSYEDGTLKIAMDPENETEWFFCVENRTQGFFSDWYYSDSDPYVTAVTLDVKAGDEIVVQVNTYNSADMWDTPAGEVSFHATAVSGEGTAEIPYNIVGLDADITVPAGQTVYCTGRFSGMFANIFGENVTIENEGNAAVSEWGFAMLEITGGDFFNPPVFTLTNTGEQDATYNVLMTYPVGSAENPAELWPGEKNTVSLDAASQGYYYTFTAYQDGILSITMDNSNKTGWFFCVENRTQGYSGDWHYSDADPLVTAETVAVTAGDEIWIQVNTYDPENMWEAPAGDVTFAAAFISGSGAQEDPYQIQGLELSITVEAGQTLYYSGRYSGMLLNLTGDNATVSCDGNTVSSENGKLSCPITGGSMWEPPVFTVTNNGSEAAVYQVVFSYPLGTMDNPDTLTEGHHTVAFDAGSREYYFTWIAPKAGTLTVTLEGNNWQYSISNLTAFQFGDYHDSSTAAVTSETLTVSEGDEIQFQLCTYDPENPWEIPAGEVSFTVTFE